jgi:hypothetical protein
MLMITTILPIKILPEALKETLFIFLGTILEKTASEIFKEQMEDKYGY